VAKEHLQKKESEERFSEEGGGGSRKNTTREKIYEQMARESSIKSRLDEEAAGAGRRLKDGQKKTKKNLLTQCALICSRDRQYREKNLEPKKNQDGGYDHE